MRIQAALTLAIVLGATGAAAQSPRTTPCFSHAPLTSSSPASAWDDLKNFRAAVNLNPAIVEAQVWTDGVGPVNKDYYAFTFRPAEPTTAPAIARALRTDLDRVIFIDRRAGQLQPLNPPNAVIWNREDPTGALMRFRLRNLPLGLPWDVAVVASCVSETDWIFTTVTVLAEGAHPVSGNRGFAVRDNGDGTFTVLTKAYALRHRRLVDPVLSDMTEAGRLLEPPFRALLFDGRRDAFGDHPLGLEHLPARLNEAEPAPSVLAQDERLTPAVEPIIEAKGDAASGGYEDVKPVPVGTFITLCFMAHISQPASVSMAKSLQSTVRCFSAISRVFCCFRSTL